MSLVPGVYVCTGCGERTDGHRDTGELNVKCHCSNCGEELRFDRHPKKRGKGKVIHANYEDTLWILRDGEKVIGYGVDFLVEDIRLLSEYQELGEIEDIKEAYRRLKTYRENNGEITHNYDCGVTCSLKEEHGRCPEAKRCVPDGRKQSTLPAWACIDTAEGNNEISN